MIVFYKTDIGNTRQSNQDTVLCAFGRYGLFGVADGMGGHNGGDIASAMAADKLPFYLKDAKPSIALLRDGIMKTNRDIYDRQLSDELLSGMGTTLTVLWESDHHVYLGHVGDSRAYCLSGKLFRQITRDHTLVQDYIEHGLLTAEEAKTHPWRNVITRAVGTDIQLDIDAAGYTKHPGDIWLVCSDGLYEYVSDPEMEQLLLTYGCSEKTADQLVSLALERGGNDNISVLLAEVTA